MNHKQQLYHEVIRIKRFMGFRIYQYGIDLVKEYEAFGIRVTAVPFKTRGLRGMAAVGEKPDPDVILLNNARTQREQNFDCSHETMHLALHRRTGRKTFNCYNIPVPNQDPFLEWQANEGAAEFLMPYVEFIPMLRDTVGSRPTHMAIKYFTELAGDTFLVPEAAIKFRLENLKYEIFQYYSGVDLSDIQVLSKKQQERQGLYLRSLNDIPDGESFDIFKYINEKATPVCAGMTF